MPVQNSQRGVALLDRNRVLLGQIAVRMVPIVPACNVDGDKNVIGLSDGLIGNVVQIPVQNERVFRPVRAKVEQYPLVIRGGMLKRQS